MEPVTSADLALRGLTSRQIARLCSQGKLSRIARGLYLEQPGNHVSSHRALAATRTRPLALESAALVHGLPLMTLPRKVQTIQPGDGRSRSKTHERILSAPLPDHHLTVIAGQWVTTRARTVVDLARLRGLDEALVPWDAARWAARRDHALEIFDDATDEVLASLTNRKGVARARQARGLSSAFSESPAETRSLLSIRRLGLPEPVQQFEVVDGRGNRLGFGDFGWPDRGVLGEYDGKDKYTTLARPGETPADVIRREKRRQESMEAQGWIVARWGAEELADPTRLRDRIEAAFEVARRRGARPLVA